VVDIPAEAGAAEAYAKAMQRLRQLSKKRVPLSGCFNQFCSGLFRNRFSFGNILVHVSTILAVLLFAIFVYAAWQHEPYYARGRGMCVGRCGSRTDCWNNITLELPLFDKTPSCPGEGHIQLDGLHEHQCPAVLLTLKVSNISMDNRIVTTVSAAGSAGGASKLTGNAAVAAAAAAAAAEQPAGTSGRRLQSGCSCDCTSPLPAAAAGQQQGGSSSSPSPAGAAGGVDDQPGKQQYMSPTPDGTQPGTDSAGAAAASPAVDAVVSPGPSTGDGTSSSSSSPSPPAGKNEVAVGDTQPSSPPADVPPNIPNSPSPSGYSTPPTGDTAVAAPSPSPASVSTMDRDAGSGSSSSSPSPSAIAQDIPALLIAGQEKAATICCTANIILLDAVTNAPAKEGVSVTAVWYVIYHGRNTLSDSGAPLQNATAKTGAKGSAVFTSPPINAKSGYGCNITVKQPSDGSYELDEKGSTELSSVKTW
jgi:hypothetical protein